MSSTYDVTIVLILIDFFGQFDLEPEEMLRNGKRQSSWFLLLFEI